MRNLLISLSLLLLFNYDESFAQSVADPPENKMASDVEEHSDDFDEQESLNSDCIERSSGIVGGLLFRHSFCELDEQLKGLEMIIERTSRIISSE